MDEGVLEAARAVRPFLLELVGPGAHDLDDELADLLAAAMRGADVEDELRAAFGRHEGTSVFLERVLQDAPDYRPPVELVSRGDYDSLPGTSPVGLGMKFRCPFGDYVWYRLQIGERPPDCPTPTHDGLEPA
jgi:hypothetical protein